MASILGVTIKLPSTTATSKVSRLLNSDSDASGYIGEKSISEETAPPIIPLMELEKNYIQCSHLVRSVN